MSKYGTDFMPEKRKGHLSELYIIYLQRYRESGKNIDLYVTIIAQT
jgi:hypothetical protein